MLKISNLTLNRGVKNLVKDLNLNLSAGSALLINGANGSGKSTLASAIAGDFKITSGSIESSGKMGVLLQNLEIDFPITVSEFLSLAGNSQINQEIINLIVAADLLDKKITQLSMGQLQRVEIAQVIKLDPDIYVLDEPFSAQDQENTELLISIFKELKASGKCLLIINHIQLNLDGLIDQTLNLD